MYATIVKWDNKVDWLTNTKVNKFKENFIWKIYFISIRKKNLNSKLCLEDIIYKNTLVISAENNFKNNRTS